MIGMIFVPQIFKETFQMVKYFLNILFVLLPVLSAYCQEDSIRNKSRSVGNILALCPPPSNYHFKIGTHFYNHDDKAYICKEDLPLVIVIYDKITNNPISASDVLWSGKINGTYGTVAEGQVTLANFGTKKNVKFDASFTVNSTKHELGKFEVNIVDKVDIDFEETHSAANYGFDENKIKNYPTYDSILSFKVIPQGSSDSIIFKQRNFGKGVKFSTSLPEKFSYQGSLRGVNINNIVTPISNPTLIKVCADNEKNKNLTFADIYPLKSYVIDLYSLCETDDDVANYCHDRNGNGISFEPGLTGGKPDYDGSLMPDCISPIVDSNHICILPGPDGTLDRFADINIRWNQKLNDFSRGNDKLFYSDPAKGRNDPNFYHFLTIRPSHNKKLANQYFCNNRPSPRDTSGCTSIISSADISVAEQNLNKLYKQANVQFNIINHGRLYANYDIKGKDNDTLDVAEQIWLHVSLFGTSRQTLVKPLNAVAWVVPMITQNEKIGFGAATSLGFNSLSIRSLAIESSKPNFNFLTLAHEIGHAVFNLRHPDDDSDTITEDKLLKNEKGDKFNFMNSGPLQSKNLIKNISSFKLRRYQWFTKIR
jgi:Tfp pilus assembly protein PilZ